MFSSQALTQLRFREGRRGWLPSGHLCKTSTIQITGPISGQVSS